MTHLKTFLQYVQNRTPLTGFFLGQTIEFDVPPRAQRGRGGARLGCLGGLGKTLSYRWLFKALAL